MRRRHRALLLCSFALALRAHADVIVVAANGTGDYIDLPVAALHAVDGDVLLLKSGTYSSIQITNKALDIVADAGANVVLAGQLRITQLAVTRCVTLTGLTLRGFSGTSIIPYAPLQLDGNAGSIRVQGCDIVGSDGMPCTYESWGSRAAYVVSSTDVAFARCTLRAGNAGSFGNNGGYGGYGGEGVLGLSARVALYDCDVSGGRGGRPLPSCGGGSTPGFSGAGGDGGLFFGGAESFLSRSTFHGGDAGLGPFPLSPGWGLSLSGPFTLPTLECALVSGAPATGPTPPGVHTFNGAIHLPLAGGARTLTTNRIVREGGQLRMELRGSAGDIVELVFAERARYLTSSAWRGVSLVRADRPAPVLHAGVVGASGVLELTWPIADLGPGVQARRIFVQAAFRDTGGVTTLSTPATVVLLDSAY